MEVSAPSACLRVFSIPEMAQSVFAYASRQDIARLSQVSRPLFYLVSSYAWEVVDDVVTLMALIPGAGVVTYTVDPLPALTVMQFPESYDLSRFNVYAPYVKELRINSTTYIDEYDNWDSFLTFAQSRSLLPNLKRIRLVPFAPSSPFEIIDPVGGDATKWASAFLSTSLEELWIAPEPRSFEMETTNTHFTWTTLKDARILLRLAIQRCPMLTTLAVLPGDLVVQKTGILSNIRNPFSELPQPFPLFKSFRNLRALTTSPSCLETRSFEVLSTIPTLESLSIKGLPHLTMTPSCSDLSITKDGFPSLRHLELTYLRWRTIFNLCSAKPLVRNLVTLRIHPIPSQSEPPNYGRLARLLSRLARIGSLLTGLLVASSTRPKFFPNVVGQLQRFPLVKLSLHLTELDDLPLGALSGALPLLEALHLLPPGDGLHVKQLCVFTTLFPRLRYLSVPICTDTLHELNDEDVIHTPRSRNPFCLESNFIMPYSRCWIALKLAWYLHVLWPMLQCVDGGFRQDPGFESPVHIHVGALVEAFKELERYQFGVLNGDQS